MDDNKEFEEKWLMIYPPEGFVFKKCPICKNPYLDDDKFAENCIWCEIHKEPFQE